MTWRTKSTWIAWLVLWVSTAGHAVAQADDPLAKVEDLFVSGRFAEAQVAARESQQLYQGKGDRHREGLAVFLLASAELEGGDFAGATEDFERSAVMLEAEGDRYTTWIALTQLGILERLRDRPAAAIARFERALAFLRGTAASSGPFSSEELNRLPKYFSLPPSDRRLPLPQPPAGKFFLSLLLEGAEVMTRTQMVVALLTTGRLEEAEAELARLTKLSEAFNGAFDHGISIFRGKLRQKQGRPNEAREIFREILGHPTPAGEQEQRSILCALVESELASGRFEEALSLNSKALAKARQAGGDPKEESDVLLLRAEIFQKINRFEEAATTLNEALEAAERSGSERHQALVHLRQGFLESSRGREEKAASYYEEAARLFQEAADIEHEALTWTELHRIYLELGFHSAANSALAKARALAERSGNQLVEEMVNLAAASHDDFGQRIEEFLSLPELREGQSGEGLREISHLWARAVEAVNGIEAGTSGTESARPPVVGATDAMTSMVRGVELFGQSRWADAREAFLAGLARSPSHTELRIGLLAFTGLTFTAEGNLPDAVAYLTQAVGSLEQGAAEFKLEEFLAGYLSGYRQDLFGLTIDLLSTLGRSEEAFDYAEKARARALLRGLGTRRLRLINDADAGLVQEAEALRRRVLEIERQQVASPTVDRERLSAELSQAREHYEALLVRLKVTSPNQPAATKLSPLQLRAVQAELPADTTLISYFVALSHVRAWVVDRETFQSIGLFTLLPGQVDLGDLICWAEELARRGGGRGAIVLGRPCANACTSEEVYEKLFAPLRPYIRHRRLVLVPHGELHYIPFAALRDPKTGRYLVEDYTLTYAPSASVLSQLRSKETPVEGRALVVGAPEELDPRLPSLPAAQRETKGVARLLGTRPLLGAAATEDQLYKRAGKVDLLHVAAHGLYEPRNPIFSRIALTPDGEHDGYLEVHEIADLDLSGVNLVVLSACDTARGERTRGDEVTSLARAFLTAGSPGVLSTLWSIDDDAAAILMKELYRRLLDGASVAEALQQAQLTLLRSRRFNQPRFWAAFALTGDPQGRWGISQ